MAPGPGAAQVRPELQTDLPLPQRLTQLQKQFFKENRLHTKHYSCHNMTHIHTRTHTHISVEPVFKASRVPVLYVLLPPLGHESKWGWRLWWAALRLVEGYTSPRASDASGCRPGLGASCTHVCSGATWERGSEGERETHYKLARCFNVCCCVLCALPTWCIKSHVTL